MRVLNLQSSLFVARSLVAEKRLVFDLESSDDPKHFFQDETLPIVRPANYDGDSNSGDYLGSRDSEPPKITEGSRKFFKDLLETAKKSPLTNDSGQEDFQSIVTELNEFYAKVKQDGTCDTFWEAFVGPHYCFNEQQLAELKAVFESEFEGFEDEEIIQAILRHAHIKKMQHYYERAVLKTKAHNQFRKLASAEFQDAQDWEIDSGMYYAASNCQIGYQDICKALIECDAIISSIDIGLILSLIEEKIAERRAELKQRQDAYAQFKKLSEKYPFATNGEISSGMTSVYCRRMFKWDGDDAYQDIYRYLIDASRDPVLTRWIIDILEEEIQKSRAGSAKQRDVGIY